MSQLADLLRQERELLGLSIRDLAVLAGVAYPTISRIENGHEQPRWDTSERIARALGRTLTPTFEDQSFPRLADLTDRHSPDPEGIAQPDWTQLRGFADRLSLHPELTGAAINSAPAPSGSAFIDNLLAAIAEKLADDLGIQRPRWTKAITKPETPWEAPGTPRIKAASAAATPSQFAARNITLASSAIWRERELASS